MRLRTVMNWIASVSVLMILAAPIARAYIHGGRPSQTIAQPSSPQAVTTTLKEEGARILPLASGAALGQPFTTPPPPLPEPGVFAIVSLGLAALGAATWQRRRRDAQLARLRVVPSP